MKASIKSYLNGIFVLDKKSRKIVSTAFSNGRKYDFRLFKNLSITFTEIL